MSVIVKNKTFKVRELFSYLSEEELDSLESIFNKIKDQDRETAQISLLFLVDRTIDEVTDDLQFHMNGITNTLTKHYPGNRECLKFIIEGIMESVTKIERIKEDE